LQAADEETVGQDVASLVSQYEEAFQALLRHFWTCFFPSAPDRKQAIRKAHTMGENLLKYQHEKLAVVLPRLPRQGQLLMANLQVRPPETMHCRLLASFMPHCTPVADAGGQGSRVL
jgi:hypothetical protein